MPQRLSVLPPTVAISYGECLHYFTISFLVIKRLRGTSGIFPLTAMLSLCHTYPNSSSIPYSVLYEKVASAYEIKIRRRHYFIKKSVTRITTQSVMFSYPLDFPYIFLRQCSIRLYLN